MQRREPSGDASSGDAGRAPRRRLTLQDIADEAGVSTGLVSMVLRGRAGPSPTTAARILQVAERLGYRANRTASQLASRRTRLLGVTMTPTNPYHGEIVEELEARAHERGYDLLLGAVTRTRGERRTIEMLVDSNCEALILLGAALPEPQLERAVDGTPTVSVGRPLDVPGVDVVRTADVQAMDLLVDHLVRLGHTRIAHMDGGDWDLPAERRHGYVQAMQARGLAPLVIAGGETEQSGAESGGELLRHPEVTAVAAYNDMSAIGLVDHLLRQGIRIPEDMSVTGFDDDRLADLAQIGLTSINPAKLDQARMAVELAVERIDSPRSQGIVHVSPATLTVRRSTAPVRGQPAGARRAAAATRSASQSSARS